MHAVLCDNFSGWQLEKINLLCHGIMSCVATSIMCGLQMRYKLLLSCLNVLKLVVKNHNFTNQFKWLLLLTPQVRVQRMKLRLLVLKWKLILKLPIALPPWLDFEPLIHFLLLREVVKVPLNIFWREMALERTQRLIRPCMGFAGLKKGDTTCLVGRVGPGEY